MIDFEKLLKEEKQKEKRKMTTRQENKKEIKKETEFVDVDVQIVMNKSGKSVNLYINETLEKGRVLIVSTENLEKVLKGEYKGTGFSEIVDKE